MNILITQLKNLGDCICLSGFFKSLRYKNPEANIIFLCYEHVYPLVELCPYINKIICINKANEANDFNNIDNIKDINDINIYEAILEDGPIDLAIHTSWSEYNQFANMIHKKINATRRVAYAENDYQRYLIDKDFSEYQIIDINLLTDRINIPLEIIHTIDRNNYILKYLYNIYIYNIECFINSKDHINLFSNNFKIVVGLGASSESKKYPLNKWINIFKTFHDISFYLLNKDYINIDLPNCINYTGKLSIRQCISVISQCDLYLGHDTFYVHAAAAYKKPCIVLYKESLDKLNYYRKKNYHGYLSSYERWKPYNVEHIALFPKHSIYPCNKKEIIICGCEYHESHCISRILEKEIIDAIKKLKG